MPMIQPPNTGGSRATPRRGVAMLLCVLAVLGFGVVAGGQPASALPAGYAPNGCTLSPDRGWYPTYYDFKQQCNRHDYCYDEMWYGNSEAGRKACDDTFLREMVGWCSGYYRAWWLAVQRNQCAGVAGVYYVAVRNLGSSYFNNPYKN